MTGIERRQFEMLVRVRNFGQTNPSVFASSPAAQQTLAALGAAIDELTATDMKKMSASAATHTGRRAEARRALVTLLQDVSRLAGNLQAEGQTLPPFDLPASRSDLSLLMTGKQFATDAAPFETAFSDHGIGPAQIAATTAAFEAAVNDQGTNRREHVAATAQIRTLLATSNRAVRRLDLIVHNGPGHDEGVQAQWTQLRRLEDPRLSRGSSQADEPGPAPGAAEPAA